MIVVDWDHFNLRSVKITCKNEDNNEAVKIKLAFGSERLYKYTTTSGTIEAPRKINKVIKWRA